MIPVIQGEAGRTPHRENSILKPRSQQIVSGIILGRNPQAESLAQVARCC